MSRKQKKYTALPLTKKQQKDILAKAAEAETAIADLEKEIAEEETAPESILPDESIEPGLRLGYDAEAAGKPGVVEGMFNYCPTCADEKVARGRAAENGQKAELILTVRDIVTTFRTDINKKLDGLSNLIENQLKPIVAMTTAVAIARKDLGLDLAQFEDNLHRSLGLDKFLDPEVVTGSLFGDALADSETPEPKPASQGHWTSKDPTLVGSEFDDMLTGGGGDPAVAEPLETALDSDDEEQWRQ